MGTETYGAVDEPLASCVGVQFQVYVSKRQLVYKFDIGRGMIYWYLAFIIVLIHYPNFTYYFSSHTILIWNSVLYLALSYSIDVVPTLAYLEAYILR